MTVEVRKNAREMVRLRLDAYKGADVADIRVWTTTAAGEDVPTSKGLTVRVELLPEMVDAMATLLADARTLGLIPRPDAA